MPDKIKITKAELNDIYDIQEEEVKEQTQEETSNATVSFEEFSQSYDKEKDKQWRSDAGEEE